MSRRRYATDKQVDAAIRREQEERDLERALLQAVDQLGNVKPSPLEAVHGGLRVGLQQGLAVGAKIYRPDGSLYDEVVQPGHSYVIFWPTIVNYIFSGGTFNTTATDTGGTSRTLVTTGKPWPQMDAAVAIDTYGIVVGTGSTAVAMTDTKLVTQVAHGTGSGQLTHGLCVGNKVDTAGANPRYVNYFRPFQNNSGAAIAITEVGAYVAAGTSTGNPGKFCMCRDLLSFTIPIGYLAIVQYSLIFNLT